MVVGQVSGAMLLDPGLVIVMAIALMAIDVVMFVASIKTFGRDHMLARLT
jgi:hypothetical protein